jgi:hypothetical protein
LEREFEIAEAAFPWLDIKGGVNAMIYDGCARTYMKSGAPMVMIGWQAFDGGTYTTFLAIEDYFNSTPSDIRYSRRAISELQADLGNQTMISNSFGNHPSLEAWFRLMGYTERDTDTDYKVFARGPKLPLGG